MSERPSPQVGVATLVIRRRKLLLGQRKKTPGFDTWQCPGGLLHINETIFDCARREVLEETGMRIQGLVYGPYSNNIFPDEALHSVTLYVAACTEDEPQDAEPQLARGWQWFDPARLPQPLFLPLEELFRDHKSWLDSLFKNA